MDQSDSTRPMSRPSGPGDPPQFKPGDVLDNRFDIVQFLARGGMGEVYEAADRQMQGKHLALKTLRIEVAAIDRMRQRFEREALLAREILHPNVCPTYDLFRINTAAGPLMFITMRLLRGESLAARLNRLGAMPLDTALPIASQMAAALDAAHQTGIIHRDFKPGNVMLESAPSGTHVFITDFGLSRVFESDGTLAQTGRIAGTLGYIAPELLQGHIARPSSDVYSFGVVLHEMLTGQRPKNKPGRTEFVRPSALQPTLPRAWDRVILGCLAHDPAQRFQSAGEALNSLNATARSTRSLTLTVPITRRRVAWLCIAIVLLLALSAWAGWPRLYAFLHPLPAKRFVALMASPDARSPEERPLLNSVLGALSSRISRSEAAVKDLLVISSSDVTRPPTIAKPSDAISALGANLVMTASVRPTAPGYLLSLQVLDAATGRILRHQDLSVARAEVAKLPEQASAAAERLLDLPKASPNANGHDELANVLPAAFQFYSVAEDFMNQPNYAGLDSAIENYQKALDSDPHFALAYARIAMAYVRRSLNSNDTAALSLAGSNADLALRYNPDSAKAVLSRTLFDLFSGNTEKAMDGFARALRLDPGNPQILYYKAQAFADLGRTPEQEQVYRDLLKERPNFWPAYNQLGFLLSRAGDYQKAADAYAQAAAVAPHVALPLASLGTMYVNLHRNADAEDAFRRSLERAPNTQAYFGLGGIAFEAGKYRVALDDYGKARDLQPKNHIAWRDIGDCYRMLDSPEQMRESYAKAAGLLEEVLATNPRRGSSWVTLGFYHAKLGRREEAGADIRKAESLGAPDAKSQLEKAQALALLGRKDEALNLVLDCLRKGISTVEVNLALDLKEIRADPRYQRYLAQARPK